MCWGTCGRRERANERWSPAAPEWARTVRNQRMRTGQKRHDPGPVGDLGDGEDTGGEARGHRPQAVDEQALGPVGTPPDQPIPDHPGLGQAEGDKDAHGGEGDQGMGRTAEDHDEGAGEDSQEQDAIGEDEAGPPGGVDAGAGTGPGPRAGQPPRLPPIPEVHARTVSAAPSSRSGMSGAGSAVRSNSIRCASPLWTPPRTHLTLQSDTTSACPAGSAWRPDNGSPGRRTRSATRPSRPSSVNSTSIGGPGRPWSSSGTPSSTMPPAACSAAGRTVSARGPA